MIECSNELAYEINNPYIRNNNLVFLVNKKQFDNEFLKNIHYKNNNPNLQYLIYNDEHKNKYLLPYTIQNFVFQEYNQFYLH